MVRLLRISALGLLALVSACTPTLGPPPGGPAGPAPFRAEDFAWSEPEGRNTIVGRLGYRQGQTRFTCTGASVVLTPETPWTRRRMQILYLSSERAALPADEVRDRAPSAPSDDYSAFVRRTTCGPDDRFSFTGLPNGAWYVITIARPASGPGDSIALMRRVVTRGGRVAGVEL